MSEGNKVTGLSVAVLIILVSISICAATPQDAEDLSKLYELEFQTKQVDEWSPAGLTLLNGGKVQLVVGVQDGGCITKETVMVKAVETSDKMTTIHLLYTLDGQPCKALFKREMKATLRFPQSGAYRIKLWINELYHDQGEVLRWEKEITI
jgi:hypothetical protein